MTKEEAIRQVREWDFLNEKEREVLEMLIPELKDSEDERIRKAIIEHIKKGYGAMRTLSEQEKALAWLEKRKENPKNADSIPTDCASDVKCEDRWHKVFDSLPDNPREVLCKDAIGNYFLGRYYQDGHWEVSMYDDVDKTNEDNPDVVMWMDIPSEKQKGQQPAEWSEDYREEDLQTRFAFYTYKDDPSVLYLSNVFVEEASRNHGFGTRILKAAEKAAEAIGATTIRLKVKQDSPANAWYRKNGYGYVTFEDGYDWLEKNLEYLKPAKSVEWSEEDEKTLKTTITHILSYAYPNNPIYRKEAEECVAWLKSLRGKFVKED